jgi:hypothetical protein
MKVSAYKVLLGVIAFVGLAVGSRPAIAATGATAPQPLVLQAAVSPLSPEPSGVAVPAPNPPVPEFTDAMPALPNCQGQNPATSGTAGQLRAGNRTEHPVRLVFLGRQSGSKCYGEPAHWDFAPFEGGSKGLILSLPQAELALKPGDILVAFAQDGSRHYWGPYVVGQTGVPVWNHRAKEWQLVLQPRS